MRSSAPALLALLVLCHVTGSDADVVSDFNHTVNQLATQIDHLNVQLNRTQQIVTQSEHDIQTLTQKLHDADALIASLTQQLHSATTTLTNVDTYCKSQVAGIDARLDKLENPAAFTVHFSNDSVTDELTADGFHGGRLLKFDVEQTNLGGHYNASTGKFTVPADGNYGFFVSVQRSQPDVNVCMTVSLMSVHGAKNFCNAAVCPKGYTSASNFCFIYLRHNDEVQRSQPDADTCLQVSLMTNHSQRYFCNVAACPQGYASASNFCLIYLRHNDQVYAQTQAQFVDDIFGYVHTTFSGFQLL